MFVFISYLTTYCTWLLCIRLLDKLQYWLYSTTNFDYKSNVEAKPRKALMVRFAETKMKNSKIPKIL